MDEWILKFARPLYECLKILNKALHSSPFSWEPGILISKTSQATSQPIPRSGKPTPSAIESTMLYHPLPPCFVVHMSQHFWHQMWLGWVSNPRPLAYQPSVLPLSQKSGLRLGGNTAQQLLFRLINVVQFFIRLKNKEDPAASPYSITQNALILSKCFIGGILELTKYIMCFQGHVLDFRNSEVISKCFISSEWRRTVWWKRRTWGLEYLLVIRWMTVKISPVSSTCCRSKRFVHVFHSAWN